MAATTGTTATGTGRSADLSDPAFQAFTLLRLGFTAAPILLLRDFYDIALRDFGLLLGALTLSRLATAFPGVSFSGQVGR